MTLVIHRLIIHDGLAIMTTLSLSFTDRCNYREKFDPFEGSKEGRDFFIPFPVLISLDREGSILPFFVVRSEASALP